GLKLVGKENTQYLWADYAILLWGIWLISNPFTLGYEKDALAGSDFISGSLVIFFSIMAIVTDLNLLRWLICAVGLWLIFAPLFFWTSSAAIYSNDTLIGLLIVGCCAFQLGRSRYSDLLDEIPLGWSYNPSSWSQ